jgi:hypothetical protein
MLSGFGTHRSCFSFRQRWQFCLLPTGVSLLTQRRWTLGIGVMVAWAALFTYGAWWLHRHRFCHIGISALAGVAAVVVSAYWFGG